MNENQIILLRDGRRLGFAEYGDAKGRPVFHFHGSAASRLDRPADERILHELAIRFISVDRPGHGLSDFQPNRRIADWPGDVSQLADILGLGQFYVEGHSAGGPYALACAHFLPDRTKAVGLIASAAPLTRPGALSGLPLPNLALAASNRWAPILTQAIRALTRRMILKDPENAARRFMDSMPEADRAALFSPENLAVFAQAVREGYRPGWRGVAHDDVIVGRDWGFPLGGITAPVDLWHGDADVNVPSGAGRYLAASIPSAQTHFLPGEGHFFVLRRWREILSALVSHP